MYTMPPRGTVSDPRAFIEGGLIKRMIHRTGIRALAVLGMLGALTAVDMGAAAAKPGGVPAIPLNNEQETTGAETGASGFFSYVITGDQLCYTPEGA